MHKQTPTTWGEWPPHRRIAAPLHRRVSERVSGAIERDSWAIERVCWASERVPRASERVRRVAQHNAAEGQPRRRAAPGRHAVNEH